MNDELDEQVKRVQQRIREALIKEYDDTGLTITEALFFDLVKFSRHDADENGYRYLHFTDWYDHFDLPALEDSGLIVRRAGKARAEGWRKHFPEDAYELTIKGEVILRTPDRYVTNG